MSAIILDSSLVHYEALGRGRPILFLHDWLGSWRYWVPTMVDMASSNRAYAPDFWGFGDSDKVVPRYSVNGYASQVELFMDQMGIDNIPIVGHGLGAVIAVTFARQHPERVSQIMMVNMPISSEHIARPLSTFGGGDNPAKAILGRKLKSYEEVDMEDAKTDGKAVMLSVRSMPDLTDTLFELEIPLLFVYGKDDPLIRMPEEDLWEDLDENVHSYFFENVQHYPMLEQTSKFNRLLRDFLMHKDNWGQYQVKDEWKRRMR